MHPNKFINTDTSNYYMMISQLKCNYIILICVWVRLMLPVWLIRMAATASLIQSYLKTKVDDWAEAEVEEHSEWILL